MTLHTLSLQNFRSYEKATFTFAPGVTVILGPNTAGKSNLIEALYLLSSGKSFRAEKDIQMISFGQGIARVKGEIEEKEGIEVLEVMITDVQQVQATRSFTKRFLVNGVPKRRVDFAGSLPVLLFVPSDLDIITSSPSHRREFLDAVLELTDRQYRAAKIAYDKALRHRNALLDLVQETGIRNEEQFSYWDELLITNGQYLTRMREELIAFIDEQTKTLLPFGVTYDKSTISRERLEQYKGAEAGAGVTLVGPHRDDFFVQLETAGGLQDVRSFGSRGQQRLVVLQLKLLQLSYMEHALGERPLLLLDDIFSELDADHIKEVLQIINQQQTILTTTHQEFLASGLPEETKVIELGKA
jgi:DNA replication and repair protein RecF